VPFLRSRVLYDCYSASVFPASGFGSVGSGHSPSRFACAVHVVPSILLHIGVSVPSPSTSPPVIAQYTSASVSYPVTFIPPSGHSPRKNDHSSHWRLSSNIQTPYCPFLLSLISRLPPFAMQFSDAGLAIEVVSSVVAGVVVVHPDKNVINPILATSSVSVFFMFLFYLSPCSLKHFMYFLSTSFMWWVSQFFTNSNTSIVIDSPCASLVLSSSIFSAN